MKIKHESYLAKTQRKEKWHKWFAWYPIRIDDETLAWLETVERRIVCIHGYLSPEYKIKDSKNE